jgi:feruloyl-CoA synthase
MNNTSSHSESSPKPGREVIFPPVRMNKTVRGNGCILIRAEEDLREFDPNIIRNFFSQAEKQPDKTLYAQRHREPDGSRGDWDHVSFADAKKAVESIGQWLISQGLCNRDTVLIISGNSIDHALMRLGTMAAGVTCCPISANYALMGGAYERLHHVIGLVNPRVIFTDAGGPYDKALQSCDLSNRLVVSSVPEELSVDCVPLASLMAVPAGEEIAAAIEMADPDAPAMYMLTSGSTGMPKAVIQTQRMLSTNMHQAFQVLGHASGWDDVMLDWLPWSHVSGSFNLLAAAVFGGSLYIDEGKPAPGLFNETIRNLREVSVPYFCNVPAGFAVLIDALETDEVLRKNFFRKLRMVLYGAAGLPQSVLDRFQKLAVEEAGHRIFMTTGYGSTESASGCMAICFHTDKVGIGLPMPGLEVKLVPRDDRFEVRLRGDNIMPGYLGDPEATGRAFDEEGFYRTGDAARFHDENDIAQGLYFAGRLAEEFKLGTGSWVYAGQVRGRLIEALSPAITDLLLCGIGRDYIAALGVPSMAGLQGIAGTSTSDVSELTQHPAVRAFLHQALEKYNEKNPASSTRIRRFAFIRDLPQAARHELSDKGTINQQITTENRPDEIDALYADSPDQNILVV